MFLKWEKGYDLGERNKKVKKGDSAIGAGWRGSWIGSRSAGQQGKPCWRACEKMTALGVGEGRQLIGRDP